MLFEETPLAGNYLINLELFEDNRGFFARYFCKNQFKLHGLCCDWVQINNSCCHDTGTLRGLHFQILPYSETKLVRCISGSIWDVAVDLRKGSKTFGKWFGCTLTSKNRSMMYIPEGFAHGFISLEPNSEILYHVSNFYNPKFEKILSWDDPDINIDWPTEAKIISEKDSNGCRLINMKPIELQS